MYVQQQVRSRKRPLVPLNMDNEVKIEFVNFNGMEEQLFTDSASNDSSTTTEYIELATAEEEGVTNGSDDLPTPASGHRPRKRAKLDHLSVEEKAQHRKMMNRVSAQSARDRQRALMMQQDQSLAVLTAKNTELQQENTKLTLANGKLLEECSNLKTSHSQEKSKLRNLIADLENKLRAYEFQSKTQNITEKGDDTACSTLEPAVLNTYPLLKGQSLHKASAYLLLMSACFHWISTLQKSSELLKTSQNTFSVKIPSFHSNRHLLLKQLVHKLTLNTEQVMPQTTLKPPD